MLFQLFNYTLSFIMWLIVGRVVLSIFTSNRQNFILSFFIRFTEPVYKVTRTIFPFARVTPGRQETFWGNIEGFIPLLSIIIIIILRILFALLFSQGVNK